MTPVTPDRTPRPAAPSPHDEASRLYVSLGRISRALRRDAHESPVGHGALSALATLTQRGPMRLGELAAAEAVSGPSMTRIVASLEGLGAVRRTCDPEDGRAALVQATPNGRRLVQAGRAARMTALRARLKALPADQQAQVLAAIPALEGLSANAE
jgi:DNA-binding MarR family transcriptional regulator